MAQFRHQFCAQNSKCILNCALGCGGTFTAKSGVLTSPYYPENYPTDTHCEYFIMQPPNTQIIYTFTFVDLEVKEDGTHVLQQCFALLDVFEWGSDVWGSVLPWDLDAWGQEYVGNVCGTQAIGPLVSNYNNLLIR